MNYASSFRCVACGSNEDIRTMHYSCGACGGYLEVAYRFPEEMRLQIQSSYDRYRDSSILSVWQPVLPIDRSRQIERISLGERITPLLAVGRLGRRIGIDGLFLKCEYYLPTLSLKDRSMALVVLKAMEYGYDTVSIVSSGNAGASLAAYAARAGLKSVLFIRAEANPAKFSKIRFTGATLVRVDSHLGQIGALYDQICHERGWYDCNGTVNPFRCEAKKTCAYEIVAQLGWKAPDVVLVPTSTGNGLVAYGIGFQEMQHFGLIEKMPRLVAVQLRSCDPIYKAFHSGADQVVPVIPEKSISDTLLNGNPEAGRKVLDWVRRTDGSVVAVADEEILNALKDLGACEGVFCEPAGAVTIAAARQLITNGFIGKGESVVCLATGHGLNQPEAMNSVYSPEPVLPADVKKIMDYIRSR